MYSCANFHTSDVQSLHNRLLIVEGTMKNLPELISAHTSVNQDRGNVAASGSSSSTTGGPGQATGSQGQDATRYAYQSGARMLAIAPNGASVVVNLDEIAGLWISNLEAELGRDGSRFDLRPVDRARSYNFPSSHRESADEILERHLGFASTPSNVNPAAPPDGDPYVDLLPKLLKNFPSNLAREQMLQRFEVMINRRGAWCIPYSVFNEQVTWLMSHADGKGKGKVRSASMMGEGEIDGLPSLSLLACAAIGLGIGALVWVAEDNDLAVSSPYNSVPTEGYVSNICNSRLPQALGVHAGTPYALYRLGRLALSLHQERHGYAALDETFMLAYMLSCGFLLLSHRECRSGTRAPSNLLGLPLSLPPELPSLVAEACSHARMMGLNTDPDDFASFGDISVSNSAASMLGHNHYQDISSGNDDVKAEDESGGPSTSGIQEGRWGRMSVYRKEVRRRLWWECAWLDMFVAESLGRAPTFHSGDCTVRIPSYMEVEHHGSGTRHTPLRDVEAQATINFFVVRCQ